MILTCECGYEVGAESPTSRLAPEMMERHKRLRCPLRPEEEGKPT